MKPVRPFRAKSTYASYCISCGTELEQSTLPIPLRCISCESKLSNAKEVENTLKAIAQEQEKSRQEPVIIFPENCKFCGSKRVGIQERRIYFQCKSVLDFSGGHEPLWIANCIG